MVSEMTSRRTLASLKPISAGAHLYKYQHLAVCPEKLSTFKKKFNFILKISNSLCILLVMFFSDRVYIFQYSCPNEIHQLKI